VNVRPARPEDARRIAEILVETWRATYPGVMPQEVLDGLSVDDRERNWQEWIPDPETNIYVVELSGELLGFVSIGPSWSNPGIGELYSIYVTPAGQGRGAGLALMEAGVSALSERWEEAILWVATENPRARRFYERYGWDVDGERVDDSIPGASVPETRYRLSGLGRR
jgi:ribosomal protein S18 acetylase RimI-like enzyme